MGVERWRRGKKGARKGAGKGEKRRMLIVG